MLLLALGIYLSVLNQVPEGAYFAQTLQAWEQGRFIRFNGLAQWLGWLAAVRRAGVCGGPDLAARSKTRLKRMTDNVSVSSAYYQRHIFFCLNERANGESAPSTMRKRALTAANSVSRKPV